MAELDLSAPPAEETPSLPTATVTESREVVVEPSVEKSSNRIGTSIADAWDAAEKEKAERSPPEEKSSKKSKPKKEPEAEKPAEKTPEKAPEKKDDNNPRARINKLIEEEGKAEEAEEVEEPEAEEADAGETSEVPLEESVKNEAWFKALKEKSQERFIDVTRRLREKTESEAGLTKTLEAERTRLKELESSQSKGPSPEEKAQREAMENELLQLRRQYQLDNDPTLKQKYDDVVVDSEKSIVATLKRYGLTPEMEKVIEGEGGFAAFANSTKSAKLQDGETTTFQQMAKEWIQSLPITDARIIESAMDEQIRTKNAKRRFIEEEKAKAREWFEGQSKSYQASVEQQQKAVQEQKQKIESFISRATTETPWMKDIEIPATASPEEKKALEQDKRFRKDLRDTLTTTMTFQNWDDILSAALDSVGYLYERRENAKLAKENKALKARISKMQGGSATTPRSGSLSAPKGEQRSQTPQRIYDGVTADNLEREFERLASGG